MRTKILMAGDDTAMLHTHGQMLKNKGMYVYTVFNLGHVHETIAEVNPDLIFFDAAKISYQLTEAYNNIINSIYYKDIPVIFNLSEVELYLVNRKRTWAIEKKTLTADNVMDAISIALANDNTRIYKQRYITKENKLWQQDTVQLPIYAD